MKLLSGTKYTFYLTGISQQRHLFSPSPESLALGTEGDPVGWAVPPVPVSNAPDSQEGPQSQ